MVKAKSMLLSGLLMFTFNPGTAIPGDSLFIQEIFRDVGLTIETRSTSNKMAIKLQLSLVSMAVGSAGLATVTLLHSR